MFDRINLSIDWFDSLWENDLQIKIQPYDKLNHCVVRTATHNVMCAFCKPFTTHVEIYGVESLIQFQFQFIDNDWICLFIMFASY